MKKIVVSIIILVIVSFILVRINDSVAIFLIPDAEDVRESSEQLLTISTILMGFAFTVMGLLYTFDASKFIQKIKSTDYVIKRAKIILFCLWILGISSISSLILMILNIKSFYEYVYIFSLLSLLQGIILFIASTRSVYKLICNVHEYDKMQTQKKYSNYNKNKIETRKSDDDMNDTW